MERPILTAKLYTPPQVTIIDHPTLLARLDQGLTGKLTHANLNRHPNPFTHATA
jgi:hypothetical protein